MSALKEKVKVTLAISDEEVERNITENLNQIPSWFEELFYPNGYEAIILSAGPSLEKYVEEINLKERMENPRRGFITFCVKHALPRLLAMGIEPDFCVILDGRTIDADSTHGVHRKGLFDTIPQKTIFMIASMAHPSYANYLMTKGARVLGWHTVVTGIEKFRDMGKVKGPILSGGTSSGTRCVSIANAMGMREVSLVGFDSCIHNATPEQLKERDKKGRVKYLPVDMAVANPTASPEQRLAIDMLEKQYSDAGYTYQASLAKRFYTTGELLAQAQDFEKLFTNTSFDIKFNVHDDGLVNHIFTNVPVATRSHSFIDYISRICPKKNFKDTQRFVIKT